MTAGNPVCPIKAPAVALRPEDIARLQLKLDALTEALTGRKVA